MVMYVQTDRQIDTQSTDKKIKTERPKTLSNDIFYFKTVIIGGPKMRGPCSKRYWTYNPERV